MRFFSLVYYHIRSALFNLVEFFHVALCYWRHLDFFLADLLFFLFYLPKGPFRIAKESGVDIFGETPITTLDKIVKAAQTQSTDVFLDLGSGKSRALFWLSSFVGCRTIGVEKIAPFVEKAAKIKKITRAEKVTLINEDLFQTSLKSATQIYLYGTALSREEILRLMEEFKKVKRHTRIISVSFPLSDYGASTDFRLLKQLSGRFPWGKGEVYIQEKN